MEKITKYFDHDYENDTTVEYVNTGKYSMLNCSFTSEDEDYGTDTIHSDPANPPEPRKQMAYEMAQEIKEYLDATEEGIYTVPYAGCYGGYSNSTLYAIEKALKELAGDYEPNPTAWFATVSEAGKIIADKMLKDGCKDFCICEVDEEQAATIPAKDFEDGSDWFGVKRIEGFFDNYSTELIVMVGRWGGGNCALAYTDWENTDTYEPAHEIAQAISESTGLDLDDVIFLKEDKEDE